MNPLSKGVAGSQPKGTIAHRVAVRFRVARSYGDYVDEKKREHEKPMGKKEWEARQQGKKEEPEPDDGKGAEEPEKSKGGLLGRLKGKLKEMSDSAKKVLVDAPKAVQQFATDKAYRKEAVGKAKAAIKAAPGSYAKSLVKTVKHEVQEFKDAGKGIAAVMTGKKPTPEQKHAIKTVAKHMAIMVAAAAFSTATAGAGAAFIGKAMGKHMALKAAANVFGDLHTLGEVGIIGKGLLGILKLSAEDTKKLDPDEALAMLVTSKVLEQMENLTDDDMAAILEDAAKTKKEAAVALRVAARYR